MTDPAASRRAWLLDKLASAAEGMPLADIAQELGVDERTVRRDVEALHGLLSAIGGVSVRRGSVVPSPPLAPVSSVKEATNPSERRHRAMAEATVRRIPSGSALVLTAGRSVRAVAAALRRVQTLGEEPRDLIVFTNNLPALLELIAGGISTGVVGEVYNASDRAFHSHELRTRYQASMAVVGASGLVLDAAAGTINLCSDRIEEASFMRQLLAPIPGILVVADSAKIGRHHPWSFTSDGLLVGKAVHIVTTQLEREKADGLAGICEVARRSGITLTYEEVPVCAE